MLDRVTFTGADDSVHPTDLVALAAEFPFVEFGILVSPKRSGVPRYPSADWMHSLCSHALAGRLQLSMHVCGQWARDVLGGLWGCPPLSTYGHAYQRVQLNIGKHPTTAEMDAVLAAIHSASDDNERQVIVQTQPDSLLARPIVEAAADRRMNVSALWDPSGGTGVESPNWPSFYPGGANYFGYAGGLGPDNLSVELPEIASAAFGGRHWVDMESRVRSDDDKVFDLARARRCLEIAVAFVIRQPEAAPSARTA